MSTDTIENTNLLEASLAPREGELLSLPFDQYSRMRIAENIVTALHGALAEKADGAQTGFELSVLDVGGYPGILPRFLPGEAYDISVLDVVPDDGSIPNYTQGSGLELPFEDGSFDVATSLDTLEHIPNANRQRFLEELQRVARNAVVLINPIQSIEADLAEETLDEYIRWILDAQQEQLAEHRQFGLPDFPATIKAFEREGWKTLSFPTANIHNWLFMMVAKHYLISMRDERADAFERTLDRFYNLTFQESDRAAPAYRGVMVAVRPERKSILKQIGDMYPPLPASETGNTARLQLAQLLMGLLDLKAANHEDRKLREQLEHRDKHVMALEGKVALLDVQKHNLERLLSDTMANIENERIKMDEERIKMDEERANTEAEFAKHIAEFAKHKAYIARLEEEQKSKDEHILYLEKLLQGIESGRVMRLTRSVSRFVER